MMLNTEQLEDLRRHLQAKRRDRLARNGNLGPVIKALHDLAQHMRRKQAKYPRTARDRTDYDLLMRAGYGPILEDSTQHGRAFRFAPCPQCGSRMVCLRHRRAEVEAAEVLTAVLVEALGGECGASIAEVLATADRLAAQAMPLLAELDTAA